MNIDARCGGFAFPFSLASLLSHYEHVHCLQLMPRGGRNRGGPLRALRRVATFQHCQTIVCCCATVATSASRRRPQPWATAARAEPCRNVPTFSNNRLFFHFFRSDLQGWGMGGRLRRKAFEETNLGRGGGGYFRRAIFTETRVERLNCNLL